MDTQSFIQSIQIGRLIYALEALMIKDSDNMNVANEQMIIPKDALETLWYEDANGNRISSHNVRNPFDIEAQRNVVYQVTRFPLEITTNYLKLVKREEVDACDHPDSYIVPTYGWTEGYVGRECKKCNGTQVKRIDEPWPERWNAEGSRQAFTTRYHIGRGNEDVILAMANSGDYSLSDAILIYSQACERCMNVLAYKYLNGKDGYPEYSEQWMKCNTVCEFCKHENVGAPIEKGWHKPEKNKKEETSTK